MKNRDPQSPDPRFANLIKLSSPDATRAGKPIGMWRGARDGVFWRMTSEAVRETQKLINSSFDIRHSRAGPLETGERIRESSGAFLKTINGVANQLRTEKARLRNEVAALNPTKDYKDVGHWQPQFDLRIIEKFEAMAPAQKAAIRHDMADSPLTNLELSEAFMRVPRALSGIDHRDFSEVRLGLIKVFKSDEFETLDLQIDQMAVTEKALSAGLEVFRESGGNTNDLLTHAPDALAYGASQEAPLGWLPPKAPA
jgi:hypothetical protein